MKTLMLTNFAGRHSLFENGKFIGSAHNNMFGGVNIQDAHGMFAGYTQEFGDNTMMYDKHNMYTGYSRPNLQGGYDTFDAHNQWVEHSVANINGLDHYDTSHRLISSDTLMEHFDGVINIFRS